MALITNTSRPSNRQDLQVLARSHTWLLQALIKKQDGYGLLVIDDISYLHRSDSRPRTCLS